jgi:hypothetical protein
LSVTATPAGGGPPSSAAWDVRVDGCEPATFADREDRGEPIVLVTLSNGGEPLGVALRLAEARKLAAGLLVGLASHGDPFADLLLFEHFPHRTDTGEFHWPHPDEADDPRESDDSSEGYGVTC